MRSGNGIQDRDPRGVEPEGGGGIENYAPAREPTPREWAIRDAYIHQFACSLQKTAFSFGIERAEVLRAVSAVRWWLQDSGYTERYRKAIRAGFSQADARLHAEQEAAYRSSK